MLNKYFDITLTLTQKSAFEQIMHFAQSKESKVFILKGYAGTGKSTIVKGILKWMNHKKIDFELLASTGRAAKVISDKTGFQASTIHGAIYNFKGLSDDLDEISKGDIDKKGQISLNFGLKLCKDENTDTVYIVDEASLIGDRKSGKNSFASYGSDRLLSDLLNFDNNGKFLFIGDSSQLPPIDGTFLPSSQRKVSPALTEKYIQEVFSYPAQEFALTEIKRQDEKSGIVKASMMLRGLHEKNTNVKWPPFLRVRGHQDIILHQNHINLVGAYIKRLKKDGFYENIMICQSNQVRHSINLYVRKEFFPESKVLAEGDLLSITQNHSLTGLANGDLVEVLEIFNRVKRAGLIYLKVRIQEIVSKDIYITYLIEDILLSPKINISEHQHKKLLMDFHFRMGEKGIKQKSKVFNESMRNDQFLNGMRAVYGYAISCHKSQGGEWNHVYLYLDNKILGIPQPEIYQWWYTAVTRAKVNLHLVDDWFIK